MTRTLALLLAAACAAFAGTAATAQDYPSRPVKIIVPFAAGGPADVYARFLGARLQESMGQPFVVENRPGAGAVTGTDAAAQSAPDGYTLLLISNAHTVNETLIPNKPYALLRDFVPVAPINYSDLVLVVNPVGGRDHAAGVPGARQGAARQAQLRVVGPGTPYHMAGELFKSMAGVDIVHVPVQGELGRAHRRARRPGRDDVRRGDHDERTGEGRQGEGARHQRQDALVGDAERADGLRGRRAGLRGGDLAGRHGAEGHAAPRSSIASTPR